MTDMNIYAPIWTEQFKTTGKRKTESKFEGVVDLHMFVVCAKGFCA